LRVDHAENCKQKQTKHMVQNIISNSGMRTVLGLLLSVLTTVGVSATDNRAPEVPDQIAVGEGFKVNFHGLGIGVQIYTWDGTSWGPATPRATLYDAEGNVVATHFAGPRWKSNSGSQVKGTVVQPTATVDTNSIPWVRLSAVNEGGNGIFAETKFIQRVNTFGGKSPKTDGAFVGDIVEVPYVADYFFYRAETN
jgi:hypothetical protein